MHRPYSATDAMASKWRYGVQLIPSTHTSIAAQHGSAQAQMRKDGKRSNEPSSRSSRSNSSVTPNGSSTCAKIGLLGLHDQEQLRASTIQSLSACGGVLEMQANTFQSHM